MTAHSEPASARRAIRSYVLRAGRMTVAQRRALNELWPRFGLEYDGTRLDFDGAFGRRAPRVLEIGFGDGELLTDMAARDPASDYLGIEVHEPGVGHCLLRIEQLGLTNVRLIRHDAVEVLQAQIGDGSLARVHLYFPDPWPKKRHHKRRIVQPEFARLVAGKLQPEGVFRMATDWAPYGEHVELVMANEPSLEKISDDDSERLQTKFERRGERLGHDVYEQAWRRCAVPRG